MAALSKDENQDETPLVARNWVKILSQYREPDTVRSVFELLVTLIPFLALWSLAWWLLSDSPWLALAVAASNGFFLVRIFIVQHDCSHGGFFKLSHGKLFQPSAAMASHCIASHCKL